MSPLVAVGIIIGLISFPIFLYLFARYSSSHSDNDDLLFFSFISLMAAGIVGAGWFIFIPVVGVVWLGMLFVKAVKRRMESNVQ